MFVIKIIVCYFIAVLLIEDSYNQPQSCIIRLFRVFKQDKIGMSAYVGEVPVNPGVVIGYQV